MPQLVLKQLCSNLIITKEKVDLDRYTSNRSKPAEFQLTVNFRSHAGIVNCAHSIIQLIQTFWPHSIDALAAEEGIVEGKAPIFFTDIGDHKSESSVSHVFSLMV